MPIATGIHHLALSTKDMKKQIQFFSEVCGMELVGLFEMHGTHGAFHCFLKLNDTTLMSFVQSPDVAGKEPVEGVSYAHHLVGSAAPGGFQHVAFNLGSQAELLAMRDRIRKAGYATIGTMDHGISKSIYLNAPENIIMEFTTTEGGVALSPEMWVDPNCVEMCGISTDELQRFLHPEPLAMTDGSAPNPADPKLPLTLLPESMRSDVLAMTDEEFGNRMNYTVAPNAERKAA
jgi:catechol 2,3-dioxygenase-like lactoylglutathione lyase family enzyme